MATLKITVNATARTVELDDPETPLLYVLRNDLGLTGTHFGCGLSQCGACTVLIDGLGSPERPDPIQAAFIAEQAAQCGYCTSGMVVAARALLQQNRRPNEAQVREALAGNLCRCGSHARVIRAVLRAAAGGR